MVDTELYITNGLELCKTFSTLGNRLLQVETNILYGSECIDVIDKYVDGKPVSRFTYIETDTKQEEPEETD